MPPLRCFSRHGSVLGVGTAGIRSVDATAPVCLRWSVRSRSGAEGGLGVV